VHTVVHTTQQFQFTGLIYFLKLII